MAAGSRACSARERPGRVRASASATTASGSSPCRSNSGSSDAPSTNDITNSGGTSGGSPASSQSTSGTGTAVPCSARISRAWRSTSRLRTGGSPGGATLTTTRRSPMRRGVGEARRAAGERRDVVGAERREPITQVVEVERPRRHLRSIPTRAWSMCREGRAGHGRQPWARQGRSPSGSPPRGPPSPSPRGRWTPTPSTSGR